MKGFSGVSESIFLKEAPVKVLLTVKRSKDPLNKQAIARETEVTYAHTVKLLKKLQDLELVNFEQKGREKIVTLSNSGMKLSESYEEVLDNHSEVSA